MNVDFRKAEDEENVSQSLPTMPKWEKDECEQAMLREDEKTGKSRKH